MRELANRDPPKALREADRLTSGTLNNYTFQTLMAAWIDRDAPAALEELEKRMADKSVGLWGNSTVNTLVSKAAEKQPRLAADWTLGLPANMRQAAAIVAGGEWVAQEPAAALTWASANRIPLDLGESVSILGKAASEKPAETAAWLRSLPASAERERLIQHVRAVSREEIRDAFEGL